MGKIAFSTIIGVIFGCAVIVWGVTSATNKWQVFLSFSSFLIVLGGTITSSFIAYRAKYIKEAILYILQCFVVYKINPNTLKSDVGMIIQWAKQYNKDGLKAIESLMEQHKANDFLHRVFSLISTGYTLDEMRSFAESTIEEEYYRKLCGANILKAMASSAPAFGMVGTLIGLIVMLGEMEDPSRMGPGLSVALLTTLYGVVLARFVFAPVSSKVSQNLGIRRFREYLLLEGITLILQKKSSFYIQDKLNSFLDRKNNFQINGSSKKKSK